MMVLRLNSEHNSLTVLLGNANAVYYYEGDWEEAWAKGAIYKTNFASKGGLGDVIRKKQLYLDEGKIAAGEGRKGLMVLIKAGKMASYENIVDVLDEILINEVKKYALVKPEMAELSYLDR